MVMSIQQYASELRSATTPWRRFSLFIRSLRLRYKLWSSARHYDRQRRLHLRR